MRREDQRGNILVTSLLLLLVMNLLGVGLVQASVQGVQVATYKTVNSQVFHITESCTRDVITWLQTQSTPSEDDYTITQDSLDAMLAGNETAAQLTKLDGYSFTCTMTSLISKTEGASSTGGEEIGTSSGYGTSGDLSPKYYYEIQSTGSGPKSATREIHTIVSVMF